MNCGERKGEDMVVLEGVGEAGKTQGRGTDVEAGEGDSDDAGCGDEGCK